MGQQQTVNLLTVDGAVAGSNVASGSAKVDTLKDEVYVLRATKTGGSGNLDAKVQDSIDGSAPWFDLATFTQLVDASGQQVVTAARRSLPFKRTVRTIGGTGVYDVDIDLAGYYA